MYVPYIYIYICIIYIYTYIYNIYIYMYDNIYIYITYILYLFMRNCQNDLFSLVSLVGEWSSFHRDVKNNSLSLDSQHAIDDHGYHIPCFDHGTY